jgi:amino acid adenylation domain-containing protein
VRYLDDNNLEYLGRADHQVKLRGFRIELGEIESQLLKQDGIRDAVVVLDKTDSDGRLVAYVTVSDGIEIDRESLTRGLSLSLPEYMVPVIYIALDALPLTSNGKVDHKALPQPGSDDLAHAEYQAPQGENEVVLAEIWQTLLNVGQVSRNDNFFRLGGHSLLIIRLIAELQSRELNASVRTVFDHPILKNLAHQISASKRPSFQAPANLITVDCTHLTPDLLPLVALEQSQIDHLADQIPGGMANIQDIYPLGPLQEGILFHHLLSSKEQGDTYIVPTLLVLPNQRQADRLTRALNCVVARHDVLRTAIFWDDLPRPVQVVLRDSPIVANSLTLDPSKDTIPQLRAYMAPGQLWMEFSEAPLLRLDMAADPSSDQVFVIISQHHIINDHIGLEVLIKEAGVYLTAEQSDDKIPPELSIEVPYREFIAHTLVLAESGATQAYFKSLLGDVDEPTVPFGLYDTQIGAAQIREFDYVFDEAFCHNMRQTCLRLDISIASVFHLAWALVIGRCSGSEDVVFGTVLSGRLQGTQGAARSMGLFINTLPIRLLLNTSVEDALKQTHVELLNLLEHEQASSALVRECTALSNDAPLFTSLLNYRRDELESESVNESDLKQQAGSLIEGETTEIGVIDNYERTNYPLALNVNDLGGEHFSLNLQAVEDVNGERLIGYARTAVETIIQSLAESDGVIATTPVRDLNVLSDEERQHLLVGLNQTDKKYPDTTLIHSLFEAQASATPNAIAVVFEGKQLTYKALNQRANQLAHSLIEQGVKPDSLVGLCLERSLEMVIGLFGILKAGGAYVPLDPTFPEARLAYQIDDANLEVIVSQESLQEVVASSTSERSIEIVCLDCKDTLERLQGYSKGNPSSGKQSSSKQSSSKQSSSKQGLKSTHLAYVIYTSGTTGNPKGVMVEHQALVNRIDWMQNEYDLLPSDKVLQKTPFTFDVSVWEFLWPLTHGSQLVIAKPGGHQDPDYLTDLIARQEISILHFVPSMLNAILPSLSRSECVSLRKVFSSGEALSKNVQDQFFTVTNGCELHNLYGPTEAAIDVSYWACEANSIYDFVPIGKPIQNSAFYIVNEELGLCPQGVSGELLIGGVGLARGYLNQPELTAEKFIANPFQDNSHHNSENNSAHDSRERLYRSGDLVRWLPDGNVEYLGRIDHQIKLRGFRIELAEIESQLFSQEAVSDTVVVLDESGDEGCLVAYVAVNDGFELDRELLRQALSLSLPEYMVPAIYIELDTLPLTSNGKVDRKALPSLGSEYLQHAEYEAPQGDTEIALAEIWQNLLNVERVSRHDNFFRLGGHSLLAIRHVNMTKSKLNFQMPLNLLFDASDLQQLAKYIDTLSVCDNDSREEIEF